MRFFSFFNQISPGMYFVSRMLPEHSSSFLEARRMIPDRFRENLKFEEKLDFWESFPDTFFSRKFAQTIKSTQRMHRWIAYDLRKNRKLIQSETNTQILRNLHFCDQNLHFFDSHVDAKFPVLCYYS